MFTSKCSSKRFGVCDDLPGARLWRAWFLGARATARSTRAKGGAGLTAPAEPATARVEVSIGVGEATADGAGERRRLAAVLVGNASSGGVGEHGALELVAFDRGLCAGRAERTEIRPRGWRSRRMPALGVVLEAV